MKGFKGDRGLTGDKGEPGPPGRDGLPGDKGLQGISVCILIKKTCGKIFLYIIIILCTINTLSSINNNLIINMSKQ